MGLTHICFSRYTRWLSNVILLLLACCRHWRQHPVTPFRKTKQLQGCMTEHMSFRIHWIAAFASFQTPLCQNGIMPKEAKQPPRQLLGLVSSQPQAIVVQEGHCHIHRLCTSSLKTEAGQSSKKTIFESLLENLGQPNCKTHIHQKNALLQSKSN